MTVLFVGFGSVAQKHKHALLNVEPGAIIYALRSKKESSIIPSVINLYEWSEIPSGIDFAIITTPTFLHAEALGKLLYKNIPVAIEKPIAHNLDGLDSLAARINAQQAFVYVTCNLRFLSALKFLKEFIQK